MATLYYLNFNLNLDDLRKFPPLRRPYTKHKLRRQQRYLNLHQDHTKTRIDDLNDTLLELIFINLPWRQLSTCKCVSTRWNSIVSNPDFLGRLPFHHHPFTIYLIREDNDPFCFSPRRLATCLITEHPHFQRHRLRLAFHDQGCKVNIVTTHKDLLISYHRLPNYNEWGYYISNPLTKTFLVVRDDQDVHDYRTNYSWEKVVGFAGFVQGVSTPGITNNNNNNNQGFRIVRIMVTLNDELLVLQIYSSKTGRWKLYQVTDNPAGLFTGSGMAVTLNNKIYFRDYRSLIMVVVDPFVDEEDDIIVPRFLKLPEELDSKSVLGVSRNRLHIAKFEDPNPNISNDYPRIKVWEIEDYCDDFTSINHTINKMAELRLVIDFALKPSLIEGIYPSIFREFPRIPSRSSIDEVICCHPSDPRVIYFSYGATFYRYDAVRRRLKMLAYCENNGSGKRYVFLHPLLITP